MAKSLLDWIQDWIELGPGKFATTWDVPFLLHLEQRPEGGAIQPTGFSTLASKQGSSRVRGDRLDLPMQPVIKEEGKNAFGMMITVGRANNNDIVLDSSSASKFHAYFERKQDAWFVQDAGSSNGTFLNEEQLAPRTPTQLSDGVEIRFGKVLCKFLTPDHAREMLQFETRMLSKKRPGE